MLSETDIAPYCSVVLAKTLGTDKASLVPADLILVSLEQFLRISTGNRLREARETGTLTLPVGGNPGAWRRYRERRKPGWVTGQFWDQHANEDLEDVTNHVLMVWKDEDRLAVLVTEDAARNAIVRAFGRSFGGVSLLSGPEVAGAFGRGATRSLWLTSVARTVPSRPTAKVLDGTDLRSALDPVGDQHFAYSAGRWRNGGRTVGIAPRSSRVWTRKPTTSTELQSDVAFVLAKARTARSANPLPMLAESSRLDEVRDCFEAALIAMPDPTGPLDQEAQRIADEVDLAVTRRSGAVVDVNVRWSDAPLGVLRLDPYLSGTQVRVRADVVGTALDKDRLEQVRRYARRQSRLRLRYATGHTVFDGAVFRMHIRDAQFTGWAFAQISAAGYDVRREKPLQGKKFVPSDVGLPSDSSLFGWVWNSWAGSPDGSELGWLTCDDGGSEIADFVHVDDSEDPPLVSLIHAKGAKSALRTREIAVSEYEVVVGQAVKNLRWLDLVSLGAALRAGKNKKVAAALTKHNGVASSRTQMADACERIGADYRKQVVILQPRIRASRLNYVRDLSQATATTAQVGEVALLRQLDMLLLSARAECAALGADLLVVGDDPTR